MTRLECTVASCVHNSEKCCCKQGILVEGVNARKAVIPAAEALRKTAEACSKTCLRRRKPGCRWTATFWTACITTIISAVQRGSRSWEMEPGLLGRRSAAASENGRKRKGRRGFWQAAGDKSPAPLWLSPFFEKVFKQSSLIFYWQDAALFLKPDFSSEKVWFFYFIDSLCGPGGGQLHWRLH